MSNTSIGQTQQMLTSLKYTAAAKSAKTKVINDKENNNQLNNDQFISQADNLLTEYLSNSPDLAKLQEHVKALFKSNEETCSKLINPVTQFDSKVLDLCTVINQYGNDANSEVKKILSNYKADHQASPANTSGNNYSVAVSTAVLAVLVTIASVKAGTSQLSLNAYQMDAYQQLIDKFQAMMLLNSALSSKISDSWQQKQQTDANNGVNTAGQDSTDTFNFNDVANSATHGLTPDDGVTTHQYLDLSSLLGEHWGQWDRDRFAHNPLIMALVSAGLVTVNSSHAWNWDNALKLTDKGNSLFSGGKIDLMQLTPVQRQQIIDGFNGNKTLAGKPNGTKWQSPVDGQYYETSDYDADKTTLTNVTYDLPTLKDQNGNPVDLTNKLLVNADNLPADFPVYTDSTTGKKFAAIDADTLKNYLQKIVEQFTTITGSSPDDLKDNFTNAFLGTVGDLAQASKTIENKISFLQQQLQAALKASEGASDSIDQARQTLDRALQNYNNVN